MNQAEHFVEKTSDDPGNAEESDAFEEPWANVDLDVSRNHNVQPQEGNQGADLQKEQEIEQAHEEEEDATVSDSNDDNNEPIYYVETILKTRVRRGTREFLIKLEGYAPKHNTWKPQTNISEELAKIWLAENLSITISSLSAEGYV